MKPVDQTVDGYPNGNCFAACVASLLEMSIEEMPSIEGKRFYSVWNKWLAERGLAMVDIPAGSGIYIAGYCIGSGDSPRVAFVEAGRRTQHAIVLKDMEKVHDPHPSKKFIDGPVKEYTVIYPLNLAALAQKTRECEEWKTWGIVEIAVRNPSVADYCKHWEERATKAEAQVEQLQRQVAELSKPVKDEPKYWAIVGHYTQDIIGVCTDQEDVLAEEPKATFIEISQSEYDTYGDEIIWDRAKRNAVLASRARTK